MVTSDRGLSAFAWHSDRFSGHEFWRQKAEIGLLGRFSADACHRAWNHRGCARPPQGSRPADPPSGAGVAGAAESITGRVRSAHQVRCRAIGSAAEQKGQHVDRIGDVDGTVIVVVARIRASDGPASGEEDCEAEDGIGQVSGGV